VNVVGTQSEIWTEKKLRTTVCVRMCKIWNPWDLSADTHRIMRMGIKHVRMENDK